MPGRLGLTAGLAFLGAGLILWPIPYGEVAMLSGSFLSLWILPAALAGSLGAAAARLPVGRTALACAAGYVAATLARILVETRIDPTSHNLAPFELLIAGVVGLVGGVAGAALGRLLRPRRA